MTKDTGEREVHDIYYGKQMDRTHVGGQIYEIEAMVDDPNATHANARLVSPVDPVGGLWFRLCWLSLWNLDNAASSHGKRASPHRNLWSLARYLSDRTAEV